MAVKPTSTTFGCRERIYSLAGNKRRLDRQKQQLVKKMKEIAERKKNDLAVSLRGL